MTSSAGKTWNRQKGMPVFVPGSPAAASRKVEEINLNGSDRRLLKISQERVLALTLKRCPSFVII